MNKAEAIEAINEGLANGDLRTAVQMLAADNARMCEIVLAADELAKAAKRLILSLDNERRLERALDAFKVARNGQ